MRGHMIVIGMSKRSFVVSVCMICLLGSAAARAARVDYNRDVLPILADNCYKCHGPDEKARKAKLRLDTKDGAFRVRDGIAVLVPGKSGQSELVRRIRSADPDVLMPQPKSNRKLTKA